MFINSGRLMRRIRDLGCIGALERGGVCRLALSEDDRRGRDLVVSWMKEAGLQISVDEIGNVFGVRVGREGGLPVAMGSHLDTVATGGLYDGSLGVLAGLEVIGVFNDRGIETARPLAVCFFTNEEGVRFAPDMMGSGVSQGILDAAEMLQSQALDGTTVRDGLSSIGYDGTEPAGKFRAQSYFELHIEQGPVLEQDCFMIGAVTGVQGISWTEYRIIGISNHAGTTPMHLRRDAGYVASAIACKARQLAEEMGGDQVATAGVIEVEPNLINVIPERARVTVDLRNTDDDALKLAERRMSEFANRTAQAEGVEIESVTLARFSPVEFDTSMVELVENAARSLGFSVKTMPSGAGHDAQMFAPNCPTAMIFVPSRGGISHNVHEHTDPIQIEAGANTLLRVVMYQAGVHQSGETDMQPKTGAST